MPTNPAADDHEAYTLLMTRLIPMQPHQYQIWADEAELARAHGASAAPRREMRWTKYVRELGKDTWRHTRIAAGRSLKPFTDPISNSRDRCARRHGKRRRGRATAQHPVGGVSHDGMGS
mgnify:CR=1 FL=1